MRNLQIELREYTCILFIVYFFAILPVTASDSSAREVPPFMEVNTPPNVLIIYDTSASMREPTTANKNTYNNTATYYTEFLNYLNTLNSSTSSLWKHMKALNNPSGNAIPFLTDGVYDSYENKVCDDVNNCSKILPAHKTKLNTNGYANGKQATGAGGWYSVQELFLGNYLNFLHTRGMRDDVARQAIRDLVANNTDINFGLMAYHYWGNNKNPENGTTPYGGLIIAEVSDNSSTLIDALDNYQGDPVYNTAWNDVAIDPSANSGLIMNSFGQTPLALQLEAAYQYFKGTYVDPVSDVAYSTCINAYCEKNFVIIVTDGYPTNKDMLEPEVKLNYCDNYEDNDDNKALDDLAGCIADDDLSVLPGDQNLTIYTIGFGNTSGAALDLLQDTALNGNGVYYSAGNASELATVFQTIMNQISSASASGTGAAVLASENAGESKLFRAKLVPDGWKGYLSAFPYPSTTSYICDGGGSDTCDWEAGSLLSARIGSSGHADRTILTAYDNNTGDSDTTLNDILLFTSTNASTLRDPLGVASDADSTDMINYLRGDDTNEQSNGGAFRDRDGWYLGDIAYSTPMVVGAPPYYYSDSSYQTFKTTYADRKQVVYVGANDGMLHAFTIEDDSSTAGVNEAGRELWAFIPNNLLGKLSLLSDPSYAHEYYVDQSPMVEDVYIDADGDGDKEWRTVLIGAERGGGMAYFALDITDPDNKPTACGSDPCPTPLWEFSPTVSGNQTWPFTVSSNYTYDSSKVIVAGGTASLKSLSTAPPVWWNTEYSVRQNVVIQNNSSATTLPSGSAVSFDIDHYGLVQAGASLESGDDLRVVYWTGSSWTELDRVVNTAWNNSDKKTEVWFQTAASIGPSLNSSGSYWVYYGNSSAASPPADVNNVFDFREDFSAGAGNWSAIAGSWAINSNVAYQDSITAGIGASVTSEVTTDSMVIEADVTSITGGPWTNGFIVFDYIAPNDFKYTGAKDGANRWVMGYFDGSFREKAVFNETITTDKEYGVKVVVEGDTATLYVDDGISFVQKVSYDYSSIGMSIGAGTIGVANEKSYVYFDNIITYTSIEPAPTDSVLPAESIYSSEKMTIVNNTGIAFTTLSGFSHVLGSNNEGLVRYQISHNGTDWYYHNGSGWALVATGLTAEENYSFTNTVSGINSNISTYVSEVATGSFYFKAFFSSNGMQKVELDSVSVNTGGVGNLGESWSVADVGKMSIDTGGGVEDMWVAFVGSGPENNDEKGYFFAINVENGASLWEKKLSNDTVNFVTSPRAVDMDDDGYLERVYAGDIAGKFWRGQISDTTISNWTVEAVFDTGAPGSVRGAGWVAQPLTATPAIVFDSADNLWVYGGTGKYISSLDSDNTDQQSFYGIKDPGTGTVSIDDLTEQVMTIDKIGSTDVKVSTGCLSVADGWYLDLMADGLNASEKVTTNPLVVGGVLFFTSFVPTSDACGLGGDAWLYALNYKTGCPMNGAVIDVDGDGDIDMDDKVNGKVPGGKKIGSGVPSAPLLVGDEVIVQLSDTTIIPTSVDVEGAELILRSWKENN